MVFSKNSLKFFYFFKKINNLKKGITQKGGRNFLGRICVYTKGSGLQKFKYRFLNFFYFYKQDYYFLNIELDKRRNSFIGLILYLTGFISYVLLPEGKNVYDGCKGFILEKFNTKISLGS
jgi:ribosomal protein L2